jgi:hypothetical protein
MIRSPRHSGPSFLPSRTLPTKRSDVHETGGTPPRGLAQRIAQWLLALTLGMLLNTLSGRPARALAAYDGR